MAVANRVGNTTRFEYDDDHRLLSIAGADGVRPLLTEYDDDGRVTSIAVP